jgi:hypothetical protein
VSDYWLGGKDNFAADQALGDAMIRAVPSLPAMAPANRSLLARAVQYLVEEAGVRQSSTSTPGLGCGSPTRTAT